MSVSCVVVEQCGWHVVQNDESPISCSLVRSVLGGGGFVFSVVCIDLAYAVRGYRYRCTDRRMNDTDVLILCTDGSEC